MRNMFRLATKFRPETQAFEKACAAGFRGAEFWLNAEVLADWREVLATSRCFPLYYALHFPNELDLDTESLRRAVLLCRELEGAALVIHQPLVRSLRRFTAGLEPELKIAVENHVLDAAGFDHWAERSPGLALDVEHLWKYTLECGPLNDLLESLRAFLRRYGNKLYHLHLPGYRQGGEEHCPMHHSEKMVTEVFRVLAEGGYTGLVVSEADQKYQTDEDLRRDVALFRQWCTEYAAPPRARRRHQPSRCPWLHSLRKERRRAARPFPSPFRCRWTHDPEARICSSFRGATRWPVDTPRGRTQKGHPRVAVACGDLAPGLSRPWASSVHRGVKVAQVIAGPSQAA